MASSSTFKVMLGLLIMVSLLSSSSVEGCSPFRSIYHFGSTESSDASSLFIDHLASAFNLPSPAPYTETKSPELDYGARFATKDATIMNNGFFFMQSIEPPSTTITTLDEQFNTFLDSVKSSTDARMEGGLYFLEQAGINDYKYAFLRGKTLKEVTQYVPYMVDSVLKTIKKMIEAGGTNILVPGSLPLGCLPGYRTLVSNSENLDHDEHMCHRGLNTFSRFHNDILIQGIEELQQKHPHVNLVYGDFYKSFMTIHKNHALFGFQKKTLMNACCGMGGDYNFASTRMCGDYGVPVCEDPAKYMHWDGFGLTQEANKLLVEATISTKNFEYPCRRVKDHV